MAQKKLENKATHSIDRYMRWLPLFLLIRYSFIARSVSVVLARWFWCPVTGLRPSFLHNHFFLYAGLSFFLYPSQNYIVLSRSFSLSQLEHFILLLILFCVLVSCFQALFDFFPFSAAIFATLSPRWLLFISTVSSIHAKNAMLERKCLSAEMKKRKEKKNHI